jgi:hypothetical protein
LCFHMQSLLFDNILYLSILILLTFKTCYCEMCV